MPETSKRPPAKSVPKSAVANISSSKASSQALAWELRFSRRDAAALRFFPASPSDGELAVQSANCRHVPRSGLTIRYVEMLESHLSMGRRHGCRCGAFQRNFNIQRVGGVYLHDEGKGMCYVLITSNGMLFFEFYLECERYEIPRRTVACLS
ncbi:hypothetical protein NDU88_002862 [Pleurodeles waltl]|uniref:Uncharacterized protein n=1 Tax=Pleurodeles waltl TaxID=8319 RepID=A0AAV7WME7_PLEWA|nr:hypothetical protein NDU88_002862 [Pleurodeles waltl]